jgi:hypothetical protein
MIRSTPERGMFFRSVPAVSVMSAFRSEWQGESRQLGNRGLALSLAERYQKDDPYDHRQQEG